MLCYKISSWQAVLLSLNVSSWMICRNDAFTLQMQSHPIVHSVMGSSYNKSNSVLEASAQTRRAYLNHFIRLGSSFGVAVISSVPVVSSAKEELSMNEQDLKDSSSSLSSSPSFKFNDVYIQDFLKDIPTFTIVDAKGVPFAVVGEDAKLSSYFFTSYAEADRILKLARSSADRALEEFQREQQVKKRKKEGQKGSQKQQPQQQQQQQRPNEEEDDDSVGINPWKTARISTVPLDFGVTLANRGKIKGGYFRIAAREQDIQDAMDIEHVDDLAEGKVPLFYYEHFEIPNEKGEMKIPLFFEKDALVKEWKRRNPKGVTTSKNLKMSVEGNAKGSPPPIKVTELFSVLGELVRASDDTPDVEDLSKLMLIPPIDSKSKAKLCEKRGGSEQAFQLGERIIVL